MAYYVHSGPLNVNDVVNSVEQSDTYVAIKHLDEHEWVGVDKIDLYLATHQVEFDMYRPMGLAGSEVEKVVDLAGAADIGRTWVFEYPVVAEDYDSLEYTSLSSITETKSFSTKSRLHRCSLQLKLLNPQLKVGDKMERQWKKRKEP